MRAAGTNPQNLRNARLRFLLPFLLPLPSFLPRKPAKKRCRRMNCYVSFAGDRDLTNVTSLLYLIPPGPPYEFLPDRCDQLKI